MTNIEEKLSRGVYQGGNARKFTSDLGLDGDDILYIGDIFMATFYVLKRIVTGAPA